MVLSMFDLSQLLLRKSGIWMSRSCTRLSGILTEAPGWVGMEGLVLGAAGAEEAAPLERQRAGGSSGVSLHEIEIRYEFLLLEELFSGLAFTSSRPVAITVMLASSA